MDVRLVSPAQFRLSGVSLLIVLTGLLSLSALTFESYADFLPSLSISLPLLICAVLCAALGYLIVPLLRRLKAGQVIQEDGPQTHLRKAGTPTMGGIFFIPVAVVIALIWTGFATSVTVVSLLTLAYASIGWLDDWQILRRKSNKGISPRTKLLLQIVGAVVFCIGVAATQSTSITTVQLPLGISIALGILFFPLAIFTLVAESNATNLTDGVDGLAGGTGSIAALGLAILVAPQSLPLAIFCACLSGSCLGFLAHNSNPARVFMGDTGSLALGGALAGVGIISGHLWGLFVISGIFFIESLSVIAQVSYYKATKDSNGKGKRLLKMAPVHHHLELSGWSEIQIVAIFYLINAALVGLTVFF